MLDALELALVLLACTTPILVIIGTIYFMVSRERKVRERQSSVDAAQHAALQQDLARLAQRVEVLEAIITDKGYQLDQELRSLGSRARA